MSQGIPAMTQGTSSMGVANNDIIFSTILQRLENIDTKLTQLDNIQVTVNKITTRLGSIDRKVNELEVKIKDMEVSRTFDNAAMVEIKSETSGLKIGSPIFIKKSYLIF